MSHSPLKCYICSQPHPGVLQLPYPQCPAETRWWPWPPTPSPAASEVGTAVDGSAGSGQLTGKCGGCCPPGHGPACQGRWVAVDGPGRCVWAGQNSPSDPVTLLLESLHLGVSPPPFYGPPHRSYSTKPRTWGEPPSLEIPAGCPPNLRGHCSAGAQTRLPRLICSAWLAKHKWLFYRRQPQLLCQGKGLWCQARGGQGLTRAKRFRFRVQVGTGETGPEPRGRTGKRWA